MHSTSVGRWRIENVWVRPPNCKAPSISFSVQDARWFVLATHITTNKNGPHCWGPLKYLEAQPRIELGCTDLQSAA